MFKIAAAATLVATVSTTQISAEATASTTQNSATATASATQISAEATAPDLPGRTLVRRS